MATTEQPSDLTNYRLEMIEKTLQAIAESLERLAALEAKHVETREAISRVFVALDKHETRIHHVEVEMPTLKLTRGWIISAVVGIFGIITILIAKHFVITVS